MSLAMIPLTFVSDKYMIPVEENYLAFIIKENISTSATLAKTFLAYILLTFSGI